MPDPRPDDQTVEASTEVSEAVGALAATSTYKVLGELTDAGGVGVLGQNNAGSGLPIGVYGTVPNAATGYGLFTPDDARVDGVLEATDLDTRGRDFTVSAGTTARAGAGNVVLGHTSNAARDGAAGATIGGGGYDDGSTAQPNQVFDDYGVVGGGRNNTAGTGTGDPTDAWFATVGGGRNNTASGQLATVGGGLDNTASGQLATVGGGLDNTASGTSATVPGGENNTADGSLSFAAGRFADANGYDGAFVLGDSSTTAITAQNPDEVRSQMPIFAPSFDTTSARSEKTAIEQVDPEAVLASVESLGVSTWEFDHQNDGRHMGPMAGDFQDAFGLGSDGETIATVDADGVALAAIQGLAAKLDDARDDLNDAHEAIDRKDERIDRQTDRIDAIERENDRLRDRLDELAARVAPDSTGSTADERAQQ